MTEPSVRNPRQERRQAKRWLLLNAILLSVVGLLSLTYPVEELGRRAGDMLFRLRGFAASSCQIALVLIDDASLQRYGRWPWKRSLLARIVRAASAAHPKALGLDILLSEPEDPSDDAQLASALRDAGNAVLVAKIGESPQGPFWVEPLPIFAKSAAAVGHAEAVLGPDGICRSVPVRELSLEEPRWAFALEIARVAAGAKLEDSGAELRIGGRKLHAVMPGSRPSISGVQSEPPRFLLIDYRGAPGSNDILLPFPMISVADLLTGKARAQLQGKAVLIGSGSTEIDDRIPTPVSAKLPMPGVEIHANLVDAILAGRSLRPVNGWLSFALLCAFSFASTFVVLRWPVWRGFAAMAALLAGALLASYVTFSWLHLLLDLGPFLCAGVLAGPLAQLQNLVIVDRSLTQRLRDLELFLKTGERARRESLPAALRTAAQTVPGDLHWKVELLGKLQSELGSLYAFDEGLLEAMQEGLAVFSLDGRLIFANEQWQRFCEKQKWTRPLDLDEFLAALALPGWRDARKLLDRPGTWLDGELHRGEGLWQFGAVRLMPAQAAGAADLIMVVVTDQTARLERDRARAEALAFVTHELRTPLVSIQGFAEYLLRYAKERGSNEAAATIFQEAGRLVAIINTYLDVLRLDAGARPMRNELFQIAETLEQVARVVQPIARACEIRIRTEIVQELPPFQGDRHLIEGALLNLLSNGIKYSPSGSEVRLGAQVEGDAIVLEVWNPGPEIPAEELGRLFEPFYRRKEQEDTARGWGLGLAFVRRIAEQHGGKIEALSESGAGTLFRMHLPVPRFVLSEAHT